MAVQSSDSQDRSSSSSSQKKEVLIHKKVDDSTTSSSSSSSSEEKGVESKSGADPWSSSMITIKNKQKEEEVSNYNTTTNKVDSSSSSSEEDESEEEKGVEEEDGSEEEDESHIANQKVQEEQKSEKEGDNDEEAEEDEEEEEEESRRRSNQEIRMKKKNDVMVLVAASTEDDENVSEPKEDPNAVVVLNPDTGEIAKSQSSKRPLEKEKDEDISSADQGRRKKMKAGVAGDSSRSKFEHKFTDDDELVIMKGYVDFNFKHKRLPGHREFTDLIKPSISFPVTCRQISEKIRRLRNKYTNAMKGGKKKNTPHDLEVFELCEKIWGDQNQSTKNKERGIIKHEAEVEENSKFITFVNDYLGKIMAIGGGGICHIDLGVFDEGKRAYFAKKVKALMVKELELYSEKAELVTAVVEELKSKHRKAAI